jgi:cytosine/adenosine deaminase-related metal-dependent hydrolase
MITILIKIDFLITMNTEDHRLYNDLLIEGDSIKQISAGIGYQADKVIDANRMLVLAGFVQAHIN